MKDEVRTKFEAVCIFLDAAEETGNSVCFTIHKNGTTIDISWNDLKKYIVDTSLSLMSKSSAFKEVEEKIRLLKDA